MLQNGKIWQHCTALTHRLEMPETIIYRYRGFGHIFMNLFDFALILYFLTLLILRLLLQSFLRPHPSPPTMRWLNVGLHPLIPWCSHDVQNTGTDSPYNLYVEKQSKSNLCKDIAAAECFGRRRNVHSHANSHRKYLLEKTVRVTRKKVNAINVTSRININLLARRNLIPLTFLYIF